MLNAQHSARYRAVPGDKNLNQLHKSIKTTPEDWTSEMRTTIKLKSPKIVMTNKACFNVQNLSFKEDYIEVVQRYCEWSPHRYEIPQQCKSYEKHFKHSYMYLLNIKEAIYAYRKTITTHTDNQEQVAYTENPLDYD